MRLEDGSKKCLTKNFYTVQSFENLRQNKIPICNIWNEINQSLNFDTESLVRIPKRPSLARAMWLLCLRETEIDDPIRAGIHLNDELTSHGQYTDEVNVTNHIPLWEVDNGSSFLWAIPIILMMHIPTWPHTRHTQKHDFAPKIPRVFLVFHRRPQCMQAESLG